jgi:NAD(P)H-flavin reductase
LNKGDETEVGVMDANKSEKDILLREELDGFVKKSGGRLRVEHILSHPSESWNGRKGHVDAKSLRSVLFEPGEGTGTFLCGPPGMMQMAALPALRGEFSIFYSFRVKLMSGGEVIVNILAPFDVPCYEFWFLILVSEYQRRRYFDLPFYSSCGD